MVIFWTPNRVPQLDRLATQKRAPPSLSLESNAMGPLPVILRLAIISCHAEKEALAGVLVRYPNSQIPNGRLVV